MKRIHTESRKGNRGHKWFPNGASARALSPTWAATASQGRTTMTTFDRIEFDPDDETTVTDLAEDLRCYTPDFPQDLTAGVEGATDRALRSLGAVS